MRIQSDKQLIQYIIKGICTGNKDLDETTKIYEFKGYILTKCKRKHQTIYVTFIKYEPFIRTKK